MRHHEISNLAGTRNAASTTRRTPSQEGPRPEETPPCPPVGEPRIDLPEKFWNSFDVGVRTSCWLWIGTLDRYGYGKFYFEGKTWTAHRLSYLALVGPVDEGLHLDHLCFVPICVNPGHLEPVTAEENYRRRRSGVPLNHCKRGHEFTPENTAHNRTGRSCKACHNHARTASRAAKREAAK